MVANRETFWVSQEIIVKKKKPRLLVSTFMAKGPKIDSIIII